MTKKQMSQPARQLSSERRWNPNVCPDCRVIFRVPSDYEGSGVVCPKCDIMLRLPKAWETVKEATKNATPHSASHDPESPAPVASEPSAFESVITEESSTQAQDLQQEPVMTDAPSAVCVTTLPQQGEVPRRRKKNHRKPGAEELEWQESSKMPVSKLSSVLARRILFATIGMSFFLLLLLASSFFQLKPKASVTIAAPVIFKQTPATQATPGLDHAKYVNDFPLIEKLVKGFLEARTPEEMLLHVRQSAMFKDRIIKYYQVHSFHVPGFSGIDYAAIEFSDDGNVITVPIVVADFSQSVITVVRESGQYAVDWESWAGWSEMIFEELMRVKPTTPVEMRVTMETESYYNFDFPPDQERLWQSYRLVSPDGTALLHGYVAKSSDLDNALRLSPDQISKKAILRIKYREDSANGSQVLIDGIVADSWLKPAASK
jgi:hypothetical protein